MFFVAAKIINVVILYNKITDYFSLNSYIWVHLRQNGAIENTNKLIRQYIPKGTDISKVTDKRISSIQAKINRRPREKLNFSTPKEEFFRVYS